MRSCLLAASSSSRVLAHHHGHGPTTKACVLSRYYYCAYHVSARRPTQHHLVSTTLDPSTGIATVTMQRPPANSLSLEMLQSLSHAIQTAEQDASIQSLLLQSSLSTIFSAGLDLMELHRPDPTRLQSFWSAFQQLYLDLYGSRLACIAVMEGHAPAAGCMLALSCDYRIMCASTTTSTTSDPAPPTSPPPTIGLNESQLGIVAPPWLADQMIDTVGRRRAELAMSLGLLYTPEQALDIGLVDQLAPPDQVRQHAHDVARQWTRIPPGARVASKMLVRQGRLDHLVATRQADLDSFCNFVTTNQVQDNLTTYLDRLAKKRGAKKIDQTKNI